MFTYVLHAFHTCVKSMQHIRKHYWSYIFTSDFFHIWFDKKSQEYVYGNDE